MIPLKLFEKGKIGNMTLKNRVVMAPMGAPADVDGGFTENSINYFEARAKGGVALLTTGGTLVTDEFEARAGNMHNQFGHNNRLGKLADKVHAYGAKLCMQLSPGLGRLNTIDAVPYSVSAVPSAFFPDVLCQPLSVEQIHYLVQCMGKSARLAKMQVWMWWKFMLTADICLINLCLLTGINVMMNTAEVWKTECAF